MPSFVMLVGVPGSGKSTYAKKLNEQESAKYTIISRDTLVELTGSQLGKGQLTYTEAFKQVDHKHVDSLLAEQFKQAILNRKDVIVDMTNLTKSSRRRMLGQVSADYTKYVLYFPITEQLMFSRATMREIEGKVIPVNVLKDMLKRFEMPSEEEGFNVVGVIHG